MNTSYEARIGALVMLRAACANGRSNLPAELFEQLAQGTANIGGIQHTDDGVGHRYFTVLVNDPHKRDVTLDVDVLFDGTVQSAAQIR